MSDIIDDASRLVRGGAFLYPPAFVRSAFRGWFAPSHLSLRRRFSPRQDLQLNHRLSIRIGADHLAAADRAELDPGQALIEFFMKWTEPSPKRVLTPPGCRLRDPAYSPPWLPWL